MGHVAEHVIVTEEEECPDYMLPQNEEEQVVNQEAHGDGDRLDRGPYSNLPSRPGMENFTAKIHRQFGSLRDVFTEVSGNKRFMSEEDYVNVMVRKTHLEAKALKKSYSAMRRVPEGVPIDTIMLLASNSSGGSFIEKMVTFIYTIVDVEEDMRVAEWVVESLGGDVDRAR